MKSYLFVLICAGLAAPSWMGATVEAADEPVVQKKDEASGITLNLRRVSLMEAIKYVTEVSNLKYRIEDNAVIITPANSPSGRIVTRVYPVQPSAFEKVVVRSRRFKRPDDNIKF